MYNNTSAKYKGAISKVTYYTARDKNIFKSTKFFQLSVDSRCLKSIQDYILLGNDNLQQFTLIFKNIILLHVSSTYYLYLSKTQGLKTQISYVISKYNSRSKS